MENLQFSVLFCASHLLPSPSRDCSKCNMHTRTHSHTHVSAYTKTRGPFTMFSAFSLVFILVLAAPRWLVWQPSMTTTTTTATTTTAANVNCSQCNNNNHEKEDTHVACVAVATTATMRYMAANNYNTLPPAVVVVANAMHNLVTSKTNCRRLHHSPRCHLIRRRRRWRRVRLFSQLLGLPWLLLCIYFLFLFCNNFLLLSAFLCIYCISQCLPVYLSHRLAMRCFVKLLLLFNVVFLLLLVFFLPYVVCHRCCFCYFCFYYYFYCCCHCCVFCYYCCFFITVLVVVASA